ncbi:MAG: cytochrome c biogenesis protein CcsA [Thermomicrobiales bacterium]
MSALFDPRDLRLNAVGVLGFLVVLAGLAMAFLYAPTDSIQGHAQRIFYVHVPMAWLAYLAYGVLFVGCVGYLWKKNPKWDRLARASAELGFLFTTLVLITGSLWGRPIWGTWWQWEARLTTTLVLWFIYLGYFMLRSYAGDRERAARHSAVLGIIGAIDIPIIHQSVEWWRTLHPEPVVLDTTGPNLPDSMLYTLLVSFVEVHDLLCPICSGLRYRIEAVRDEIGEPQMTEMFATASQPADARAQSPVSGGMED